MEPAFGLQPSSTAHPSANGPNALMNSLKVQREFLQFSRWMTSSLTKSCTFRLLLQLYSTTATLAPNEPASLIIQLIFFQDS